MNTSDNIFQENSSATEYICLKSQSENTETDVVKMDFPEYIEDVPRIIGENAYETDGSFALNKVEIYNRNMLKADEDDFVLKEKHREEQQRLNEEAQQLEDDIKFAGFMKKFKAAILTFTAIAAAVFLIAAVNITSEDEKATEPIIAASEPPASIQSVETSTPETISAESAVIDSEAATTTEKIITPEKLPLVPEEGQLYFEDENISAVFEITDVKPAKLYARDMYIQFGTDNEAFVFFGALTLKNISDESFDFIPNKLFLKSSGGQKFRPVAYRDSNLTVYDSFETVDCGEIYSTELNFAGSFKGSTADIKSAYYSTRNNNGEEIKESLSNTSIANGIVFKENKSIITDEIKEKILAQINGDTKRIETKEPLIAETGEEDMTAGGISYCWHASVIDGGNTLRVDMRAKNITDYAEVINIDGFSMYPFSYKDADAERIYPYAVSADPSEIYPNIFLDGSQSMYHADNAIAAFGEDGYTEFTLFFDWNSNNSQDHYFCYKNNRGGNFSSFLF